MKPTIIQIKNTSTSAHFFLIIYLSVHIIESLTKDLPEPVSLTWLFTICYGQSMFVVSEEKPFIDRFL